jgi:hypothetical protein
MATYPYSSITPEWKKLTQHDRTRSQIWQTEDEQGSLMNIYEVIRLITDGACSAIQPIRKIFYLPSSQ